MLKGNAIVGQSGGCTAVINKSLQGVIDQARREKSIQKLWGSKFGITGVSNKNLIDFSKYSKSHIQKVCALPSSALGSSRHKLAKGEEISIVKKFQKMNVRYLFMVGGNDTAQTVSRISKASQKMNYEMHVIHIPKTIDNDLMDTDHCPGFGSVARFAAITTQEAGLDTKSMQHVDPVKIIELMGRNSGWIVAASALLKKTKMDPPHILLLPEVPVSEKKFIADVRRVLKQVGYCVVVISETIRDHKGKRIGTRDQGIVQDAFGHQYVEGASNHLATLVEEKLKVRARYDKPGTIQRMSIPYISEVDQKEAYQAGIHAVKWAVEGMTNVMVSFKRGRGASYKIQYVPVSLDRIPDLERYMPAKFLNKTRDGVTKAFVKYATPLIGGKLPEFPSF